MEKKDIVFGLDIGTRNVIGTVGYLDGEEFHVIAQNLKEHDTEQCLMVRFMISAE
jgi:cell division ATPase FtsA